MNRIELISLVGLIKASGSMKIPSHFVEIGSLSKQRGRLIHMEKMMLQDFIILLSVLNTYIYPFSL